MIDKYLLPLLPMLVLLPLLRWPALLLLLACMASRNKWKKWPPCLLLLYLSLIILSFFFQFLPCCSPCIASLQADAVAANVAVVIVFCRQGFQMCQCSIIISMSYCICMPHRSHHSVFSSLTREFVPLPTGRSFLQPLSAGLP